MDSVDLDRKKICDIIRKKYEAIESDNKERVHEQKKSIVLTKNDRHELSELMYKK